ncbi:MAG: hypothetical protein AAFR64_11770 [Pseudomonadota bacterium]
MNKLCVLLCATASLTLSACASEPEEDKGSTQAEEFAARINGTQPPAELQPEPQAEPAAPVAAQAETQPASNDAKSAFAAGTATDPNSACNANVFSQFIGQQPNAEVRGQIMAAAEGVSEVRFIAPGANYIKPDPTHPRLNVMIAVDGVIRDIRCG